MLPLFHNFLSFKTFVIQFDQTRSTALQTSSAVFSHLRGFCLNLSKSLSPILNFLGLRGRIPSRQYLTGKLTQQ